MSHIVLPGNRDAAVGGYGVLSGHPVSLGCSEHDLDVPNTNLLSSQYSARERGLGAEFKSDVLLYYLCPDLLYGWHIARTYSVCQMCVDGDWHIAGRSVDISQNPGSVRAVSMRKNHE